MVIKIKSFDMEIESDDVLSPSSPGNRFLRSTLPDTTEIALLEFFSRQTSYNPQVFFRYASDKTILFGTGRGTKHQRKLRIKVKNRLDYLWNRPHILQGCLEKAGLPVPSYISNLVCTISDSSDESPPRRPAELDIDIASVTSSSPPWTPAKSIVESPPPLPREGELNSEGIIRIIYCFRFSLTNNGCLLF